MGRQGTERRVMSKAVLVRLTPHAGAAVAAAAAARGLSRGAWLRELAVAAARLPPGERRPTAPARAPVMPREDIAEVSRLIGVVGKAAGATIQLAARLRDLSLAERHAEAEAVLRGLRVSQEELVRLVDRLRAGREEDAA
jgi:hypothetical protein